jgi:hypothetical protein
MTVSTTLCRCGSGLPVDDDGGCVVCWFEKRSAQAPRTLHPHASDLRSTAHIATASVNGRARLAAQDAAREASFGYDIERELAEVGPEPSDLLTECAACGDEFQSDYHDQYLCDVCTISEVS